MTHTGNLKPRIAAAVSGFLMAGFVGLAPAGAAEVPGHYAWATESQVVFTPPPLHPGEARLETKQLAPGVYALLSGAPAVDNSGFVVGDEAVLVIDAHINGTMAQQIIDAVRAVTDLPIRYLVNTNYHGDHTFGNHAFPRETQIVAHHATAERMRAFEAEKQFLLQTVDNDAAVFDGVTLRLPDVTFEDHLRIDLGNRVVDLHHFGPGNTPGDTVVYVPSARAAWTGNLVIGEGTLPPIFEGRPTAYLATIADLARSLDVELIIPGHGVATTSATLVRYMSYLGELIAQARVAARSGWTLEQTLDRDRLGARYLPEQGPMLALMAGFHRLNIQAAYNEIGRQ